MLPKKMMMTTKRGAAAAVDTVVVDIDVAEVATTTVAVVMMMTFVRRYMKGGVCRTMTRNMLAVRWVSVQTMTATAES